MLDIRSYIFNEKLKSLKQSLGTKCRHLSNVTDTSGNRWIKAGVETPNGYGHFKFSFPTRYGDITEADWELVEELIRAEM